MASAAPLLESLGHHVEQSAPAAMFDEEFLRHFNAIIAADVEATFQAFETLLGRPIGDDEIEPRNAAYRRAGPELGAVAYLDSRAWLGMWARRMADWWNGHDLLLTPTLGAPPPRAGLVHRGRPGARGGPDRQLHPLHRAVQHDRPAGHQPARCTGRPAACRSASSWSPPTDARTCSSASPASLSASDEGERVGEVAEPGRRVEDEHDRVTDHEAPRGVPGVARGPQQIQAVNATAASTISAIAVRWPTAELGYEMAGERAGRRGLVLGEAEGELDRVLHDRIGVAIASGATSSASMPVAPTAAAVNRVAARGVCGPTP